VNGRFKLPRAGIQLTFAARCEILALHRAFGLSARDLAAYFGVARSTVLSILWVNGPYKLVWQAHRRLGETLFIRTYLTKEGRLHGQSKF
jgi:hypothetical protein